MNYQITNTVYSNFRGFNIWSFIQVVIGYGFLAAVLYPSHGQIW